MVSQNPLFINKVFRTFQEDLNNWLNKGNNKQELDNIAKDVTGSPNVKVKDPEVFTRFLQENSSPPPPPPPLPPQQQPLPGWVGTGGVFDPQRAKEFAYGLAEMGSYGLGDAGEIIRNIDIGGQPLYEVGKVQQPLIDPRIAMQYGRALGGPEIPEWMPFVGGMTAPEALAGGAAYLTSPFDVGLTVGTAGVGPAASSLLKAGRAGLTGTGFASKLGRFGMGAGEFITTPISSGPFQKRLAMETGIALPIVTPMAGTAKRQEEGIAYPWENAATAALGGLFTVGTGYGLSRLGRGIKGALEPDVAFAKSDDPLVNMIKRSREEKQGLGGLGEEVYPPAPDMPVDPKLRVGISGAVSGEADQPVIRVFGEQEVEELKKLQLIHDSGDLKRIAEEKVLTRINALGIRVASDIEVNLRNLTNYADTSPIEISPGLGAFGGKLEPSVDLIILNPKNAKVTESRLIDLAEGYNQRAVHLNKRLSQEDVTTLSMGGTIETLNQNYYAGLGAPLKYFEGKPISTKELSVNFNFINQQTGQPIRLPDEFVADLINFYRTLDEYGGFSVSGNRSSVEIYTVSGYGGPYGDKLNKQLTEFGTYATNQLRRTIPNAKLSMDAGTSELRVISRASEGYELGATYRDYKRYNATSISESLERQGVRGAVDSDGNVDWEAVTGARRLTPEQEAERKVRLGDYGQKDLQTGYLSEVGGSAGGPPRPRDVVPEPQSNLNKIIDDIPSNLIDDAEFKYRLQYATEPELEFLRPLLKRADNRAKKGQPRVLTDSEIAFVKNRFLTRTNSRIVRDFAPWEADSVPLQPENVSRESINEFFSNVRMFITNAGDRIKFFETINKLIPDMPNSFPKINRIDLERLRSFFGKDSALVKASEEIVNNPKKAKKKVDKGLWNNSVFFLKAIRGTADLGAFLRQNAVYAISRPIQSVKALKEGLKAALSEDAVLRNQEWMESNPHFQKLIDSGMRYNKTGADAAADQRAEAFMSDFINKIPAWTGIGPILRASARFHTHFLNNIRFNVANKMLNPRILNKYKSQAEIDELYRQVADTVNVFTGEAKLESIGTPFRALGKITGGRIGGKGLSKQQQQLIENVAYNTMWAPRLWLSRIMIPFMILKNPMVRKEVARDLGTFLSTGIGILSLANMKDDVKVNYRKGEIRFQDGTGFKIWGGMEQFANFVFDALRDYKISSTGGKYKVGDPTNRAMRILTQTGKYFRGKANPLVGEIFDHITGKDFLGEDTFDRYDSKNFLSVSSKNPFIQSLAPLVVAEVLQVMENTDEPFMVPAATTAAVLGVNISSYKTNREVALDIYDKEFSELEPFEQNLVRLTYYADDTSRQVPESYVLKDTLKKQFDKINTTYKTTSDKRRAYYDSKKEAARQREFLAKEAGFDYDDPFYKEQIRHGGTEKQRAALQTYYDLFDKHTTEEGLFLYDQFERDRDNFFRTLSQDERSFLDRNTNLHAEIIPPELFRKLPPSERRKLEQSINARAKMDRTTFDSLDVQLEKAYSDLFKKIESKQK